MMPRLTTEQLQEIAAHARDALSRDDTWAGVTCNESIAIVEELLLARERIAELGQENFAMRCSVRSALNNEDWRGKYLVSQMRVAELERELKARGEAT